MMLQEEVDWTEVLVLAEQHRVGQLMLRQLQKQRPGMVPQTVLDSLREQAQAAACRSLFLTGELLKVLDIFKAHDIPAIPWKGPVLATMAYGDVALRQFDDLDILVRPRDMRRAKDLLIAEGYQPMIQLTERQIGSYLRSQYVYPLISADGSTIIELHQDIRPRYFAFQIDSDQIWTQPQRLMLGGKEVLNLAPEDVLLLLCAHGANHCWERLTWICDIAELMRAHPELDWSRLRRESYASGNERMLLLGLLLVRNLLDVRLPDQASFWLMGDMALYPLSQQVTTRLFQDSTPLTPVERIRFHLRVRERPRERWLYCLYLLTSPTEEDWTMQPLPPALTFLYALWRPVKLLRRYGRQLLKDLIGRQDY
jgi:hypothetical protein